LEKLSAAAREEYGLAGAVQHGASTLPDEAFNIFPQAGTVEVHLATGFQNIIYDSPHFPEKLFRKIYSHLSYKYGNEKRENETDEQFLYRMRKRAFGDFKKQLWHLPEKALTEIGNTLENRFSLLFRELNVIETAELVATFVRTPTASRHQNYLNKRLFAEAR
jgi:hypothetical protein